MEYSSTKQILLLPQNLTVFLSHPVLLGRIRFSFIHKYSIFISWGFLEFSVYIFAALTFRYHLDSCCWGLAC